jgi:hypothetical protein
MIDKLMGLAVPPWVRILVPLALVLAIAGAGYWFRGVLAAAEIARLEGKVTALEYAVEDRNETITVLRDKALERAARYFENNQAKLKAERDLAEYLARPPRVITRWRDRAADVPDSIPSNEPCEVQVMRGVDLLQRAIAEREGQ